MGRSTLRTYKPMLLAAVHGSKDPPLQGLSGQRQPLRAGRRGFR